MAGKFRCRYVVKVYVYMYDLQSLGRGMNLARTDDGFDWQDLESLSLNCFVGAWD